MSIRFVLLDLSFDAYNMVQKYPRKVKPPWVGSTHVTDDRHTDRQTDGFAMSLAKIAKIVMHVWLKAVEHREDSKKVL